MPKIHRKVASLSMLVTVCVFVGLLCLKETAATGGVHLYVGTGAPGDCQTIHCAQQKVRDTLAAHRRNGPAGGIGADITVHITGGSYELDRPLVFDERDHANGTVTIHWQGPSATNRHEAGFKPARILCGKALRDWEVAWGSGGSRVYKTFLGRRVWSISENGRQSNPARHPNTNPGAVALFVSLSASRCAHCHYLTVCATVALFVSLSASRCAHCAHCHYLAICAHCCTVDVSLCSLSLPRRLCHCCTVCLTVCVSLRSLSLPHRLCHCCTVCLTVCVSLCSLCSLSLPRYLCHLSRCAHCALQDQAPVS